MCEQTAKRIPAARLKAVPWTRFREEVEARLESTGEITPPHLGTLRSVRDEPAAALAESRTAGGGTETCLANRTTRRNISSRSRETNLVRRDFFKTKGRPNHHDPASAGDLPKYRRIRGCGGAGPGGKTNKLDKFFDRITSCRVRQVQMGDKVKIGSLPTAQGVKHADHPTGQLRSSGRGGAIRSKIAASVPVSIG